MKSREQLSREFGNWSLEHYQATGTDKLIPPTDEQLERLELIEQAGKRHGELGWYPNGDFSSDAEWCNGIGAHIQRLEQDLDIDDGSVMDLYLEAHNEHFVDGTINPAERDSGNTFDFQFGAYADTQVSVHARHIEDGLELAAEWLRDNEPGHFVTDEEMAEHFEEALKELDPTADPKTVWTDDSDLASRAAEQAETDLTYTESGYLRSWEWYVNER